MTTNSNITGVVTIHSKELANIAANIANSLDPKTVRIYLPADVNSLLATYERAQAQPDAFSLVISDNKPHQQFFTLDQARALIAFGAGVYSDSSDPDVVLAAAGDAAFEEAVEAGEILRDYGIKSRVVNVVNLLTLGTGYYQSLTDEQFGQLFPWGTPVMFNFSGHPSLIKALLYDRRVLWNIHSCADRYELVQDAAYEVLEDYESIYIDMFEAKEVSEYREVYEVPKTCGAPLC